MKTEERLEAQSRRDNLWFYGFDDKIDESWEESETRVRNYIEEHLNIDEASIKIKRAHRIRGKYSPRPIIVKFWHYKVRENVLKAYREKNEKMNQAPDNPSKEEYICRQMFLIQGPKLDLPKVIFPREAARWVMVAWKWSWK